MSSAVMPDRQHMIVDSPYACVISVMYWACMSVGNPG